MAIHVPKLISTEKALKQSAWPDIENCCMLKIRLARSLTLWIMGNGGIYMYKYTSMQQEYCGDESDRCLSLSASSVLIYYTYISITY
jgi:hypothetical protein